MSTLQWGAAKRSVARVVGGQDDPDVLAAAGEHIRAVLQDWNTRRCWQFLQVLAPDIPITAALGSTYALPARVKKPYVAKLMTNGQYLVYSPRRMYSMVIASETTASTPTHYTLYNFGTTGNIELLPANGLSDTLRVWYYRLMQEEGTDTDVLDITQRYEGYVLDAARARLIAEKGPIDKLAFWKVEAEAGYKRAVADDEFVPDHHVGFSPGPAITFVPDPNSTEWALW